MKRFAVLITMLLSFVLISTAQNTTKITKLDNGGKIVSVSSVVSSTATVYSPAFTLDGFLENTVTYPLSVQYKIDTSDVTSGVDIDSVAVTIQYTNDPAAASASFTVADTISLTLGTTALTATTLDLNSKKGGFYRLKCVGLGANTGALVTAYIGVYRKDH
jgi:hypothetical protein